MPHKHTRSRVRSDDIYELPPSATASSLPVGKVQKDIKAKSKSNGKRKASRSLDDTPKAFTRLMRIAENRSKGIKSLDDGDTDRRARKRKLNDQEQPKAKKQKVVPAVEEAEPKRDVPTILPGERLSDFNARVDRTMSIAGLARKGKAVPGMKERQTKHTKRLLKLQAGWREEEARLREKEEEDRELQEEEEEERNAMYGLEEYNKDEEDLDVAGSKRKKGKRKVTRTGKDDDDPWAVLKQRREAPKGLHDVAQAPPQFKAIPKEKFKVRNGAKVSVSDVPTAAGSLRRREELGEARKSIIESYRELMKKQRAE